MASIDDLVELSTRAARAADVASSSRWHAQAQVQKAEAHVSRALSEDRESLRRPGLTPVSPSPHWLRRLAQLAGQDDPVAAPAEDPTAAAARAEADAVAAVAAARIALSQAWQAVLRARLAALDAGDTEAVEGAVRGHRQATAANPVVRHARDLGVELRAELAHIAVDKPRTVATRLGVSFGLGLAYLGFLRAFRWEENEQYLPYLALFALSGVVGGAVCTNAMCMDAGRVRTALQSGIRLWHVVVVKNVALLVLVGSAGTLLSVLLAWRSGEGPALIKAVGLLVTMVLLWLGVGNVLSVVLPLRRAPLQKRRRDGTLRPFVVSLATSYLVGYVVNGLLYWKIWAKRTAIEVVGGVWLPTLMTVGSAVLTWILLTVLANSLAGQPRCRRTLARELADDTEAIAQPPVESADR